MPDIGHFGIGQSILSTHLIFGVKHYYPLCACRSARAWYSWTAFFKKSIFNNDNMKNELTAKRADMMELFAEQGKTGKALMKKIFGDSVFAERPIGIWCLGVDNTATTIEKWKKGVPPLGVGIVTEDAAIIVAPHATVDLQWGCPGKEKSSLSKDQESFDSKAATDAIIAAYSGVHYESSSDRIYDVDGSPAAEFCRQYSNGDIGAGEWDLPAIAPLQLIQEYRHAVNDCMKTIGGYKLNSGWYYSSTERDDNSALCVNMLNGVMLYFDKYTSYYVRAVSAFHFENFTFKSRQPI